MPDTGAAAPETAGPETEQLRLLAFEACFNFRDLGGYPAADGRRLRWRQLYRSDTLHRLTEADARRFANLGLRTVIDLRSRTEIDDYGRLSVEHPGLAWHHLPMLDNVRLAPRQGGEPEDDEPPEPGAVYVRIAEDFGASVAGAFDLLTSLGALPAVFHCTSGKDRTGIIAAMVLDLAGVPDDVIAEDYALTQVALERRTRWIEQHEPDFAAFLAQIPPERRAATPEKILGFLSGLRSRHGSVEEFLVGLGIERERLELFRQALLET
ncbi:MAG TPA: tyrosine-protein phosphatase [Acidimicrobiales bacterium]|nr:tyrosine-protein phosphatase [Acidimicrobiales bacterium]